MNEITLTIDDMRVKAKEGMTILEVAQHTGIDIPTLCHHDGLAPYGACRLCTVEIVRRNRSRLVASCVYPVEEGILVKTDSEPVAKIRKMLLELMWARSPGIQALRSYGMRYGITGVKAIMDHGVVVDRKMTKFELEPSFCILCGLCVRYCAEVKKKHAIGFIGRGTEREVVFFPDIASKECPGCGECYPLCPTGILQPQYALIRTLYAA